MMCPPRCYRKRRKGREGEGGAGKRGLPAHSPDRHREARPRELSCGTRSARRWCRMPHYRCNFLGSAESWFRSLCLCSRGRTCTCLQTKQNNHANENTHKQNPKQARLKKEKLLSTSQRSRSDPQQNQHPLHPPFPTHTRAR